LALAREMLSGAGLDGVDPADKLDNGEAMDHWRLMIRAQGGDADAPLPVAKETHVVNATADGVVTHLDAYAVGIAAWRLGAGRARKEDAVQAGAGVEWHAVPGESVKVGEPLFTLHTDTPDAFPSALEALGAAYTIAPSGTEFTASPLVLGRVDAGTR
jgi:thymidine phosphorylase